MIVARVNDYTIEEKEYLAEISKLLKESDRDIADTDTKSQALENLINGALVLERARTENIRIDEDEVQQEMINLQMKFASSEDFLEALSCSGCTEEQIHQRLYDKLLVKKYLDGCVTDQFEVDEEYLQAFYQNNIELFKNEEMIRVSHILIALDKETDQVLEMRQKISNPDDFYQMVDRCSECPSCCQAGDLGFIIKGKMVKEFDEVAFSLKIDEISQPVKTAHGYHIIMVTDRKEAGTLTYEEVKEPLKRRLSRIDYELKVEKHLQDLREQADIQVNDEYFKADVIKKAF